MASPQATHSPNEEIESGATAPHQTVEQIAKLRLDFFRSSINSDGEYISRIFQGQKSISEEISNDYAGRFLIELIQNGYDAHARDTNDGEIAVYLNPSEGQYGTLYVANKGKGFNRSNVEAICDVGLSDKPIGETIGNKGLGFRSVLSISIEPEIYSKSELNESSEFDGFCFRFANSSDLQNMIDDRRHQKLAEDDLPPFHIPVPIMKSTPNTSLRRLGRDGYSTVVRLPLTSVFARKETLEAINDLRQSEAPILVFLPRLSKLAFAIEGRPSEGFSLTRSCAPLARYNGPTTDRLELVDLSESGRYLICWRDIEEATVKHAIEESIGRRKLRSSWQNWSGPGEVAIAVPIDQEIIRPQFYTYLPMGADAQAPLHGLIHGAFYPKADRTSMDASVPLNEMYLQEAVSLAACVINELRKEADQIPGIEESIVAGLVVDLMSWGAASGLTGNSDLKFPTLMIEALRVLNVPPKSTNLFPTQAKGATIGWATSTEISRWDSYADRSIINTSNLVEFSNVTALSPSLGRERLTRLESFLADSGLRESLLPSPEQQAQAVEQIALSLNTKKNKTGRIQSWTGFYEDLADIFEEIGPAKWEQRRILFCDDNELRSPSPRPTRRRRKRSNFSNTATSTAESTAVFFPPVGRRKNILVIPDALKGYLAFLNSKLEWNGKLGKARQLLIDSNAVHAYDAAGIVSSVSRIKVGSREIAIKRAVLEWVFRLWDASPNVDVLSRVNIEVPCLGGNRWISAAKAVFSKGWPQDTLGTVLSSLIEKAGPEAKELTEYNKNLIASPQTLPFKGSDLEKWAKFLEAIGVKKGLRPTRLQPQSTMIRGSQLSFATLCDQLNIGPNGREYISRYMGNLPTVTYLGTPHHLPRMVPYIIGQEDFDAMDDECKDLFARLVLESLPGLGSESLEMVEYSDKRPNDGKTTWASPALAFLGQAEWLPIERAGSRPAKIFSRPKDVLLGSDTGDRFPVYMDAPSKSIQQSLVKPEIRDALRRHLKMAVFEDESSLIIQTQLLAQTFNRESFPAMHLRNFEALYWDTWRRVIKTTTPDQWEWLDNSKVLVYRSKGSPLALEWSDNRISDNGIFVRDTHDNLAARLLEELGYCVWNAGTEGAKQSGDYLSRLFGTSVKLVSGVEIQVLLDGQSVDRIEGYRLVDLVPSLPQVVSRCMAALRGFAAQQLPRDWNDVLNRVERLTIKVGKKLDFSIEGEILPLPDEFRGVMTVGDHGNRTVLVEKIETPIVWSSLKKVRQGIADAIDHGDLAPYLEIAFSAIQRSGLDPDTQVASITWEAVEDDLQLNDEDLQKVAGVASSNQDWVFKLLKPLVVCYAGEKILERLLEEQAERDLNDTVRETMQIIVNKGIDEDRLASLMETARTHEDVLDELGIDLEEFNIALKAVGEIPLTYPAIHVNSIRRYLSENIDDVMMPVRLAYFSTYEKLGNLGDYVSQRNSLDEIAPNPDWLEIVKEPTTAMLKRMIKNHLDSFDLPRRKSTRVLEPLLQVRNENIMRVRTLSRKAAPIVNAWCRKRKCDLGIWADDNLEDLIVNKLHAAGTLDFLKSNERRLIKRFKSVGIWPESMPLSISPKVLGLSEVDLTIEHRQSDEKKREKERERRSITMNGKLLDSDDLDVSSLALEIEQMLMAADGLPDLSCISVGRKPDNRVGNSPGGGNGTNRRPTSQQTDLIGFVGEFSVYKWLKDIHPEQNIDGAWVSGYRERLLPGKQGDDGLGYDFDIFHEGKRMLLEVKTHLNDPLIVQLGETEVVRANEATSQNLEYAIVYLSGLAANGNFKMELLPNPFSDDGKKTFRLDGQGLRYKFAR